MTFSCHYFPDPITVDYDYLQTHSPWFLESLGDPSPEKRRGSVTVVICRVCSSKIPLLGYDLDEHYIVKCSHCKEATVSCVEYLTLPKRKVSPLFLDVGLFQFE